MSKKNANFGISGKGYYIALVLCAVAIALTGFLYYRNANEKEVSLQEPTGVQADATVGGDVQAVATQPGGDAAEQPYTGDGKKPATVKSPLAGTTLAEYSMDALTYNQTTRDWRVHDGLDIGAEAGAKVSAAADGTVYTVYNDETMGMTVVIRHDGGYITKYASLAEDVSVKAGDKVTAGQVIGAVGSTALLENAVGDHLHFSVTCNGELMNPKDFLN
jgi:murein DD-endopeptidase MepM/ murein hydrolase activator NlpD